MHSQQTNFSSLICTKKTFSSLMASSSSLPTTDPPQKHQVFLSFRGEDTRNNFLSHLNEALKRKGIGTYFDSKELQRGEQISPALMTAIKESTISVIVFSANYASSSWCLQELSKIMEFKDTKGLIVVPIFYHVDPSHVRKQTGSFQEAFAEHEKKKMDKVQKWRHAFTQAGDLSGFHITGDEPEATIIKEIVQDVLSKLNRMSLSDCEGLIGIGPKIEKIKSLLCLDDRGKSLMIGIWGMGGIGKTTLAQVVYDQIFSQFDSHCFLANVRERLPGGPSELRNELLSKILAEENIDISTPRIGLTITKDRLRRKRVLVVLDDISDFDQLEALGVSPLHALGPGSRIIVTTRDRHVLEEGSDAPSIYEVQGLNEVDSLHLFSLIAFKQDHPIDDFKDLSNRALWYAKGVPLALKVLGGALSGKGKQYWESVFNKLKEHPDEKIMKVLKISFDGLDDAQKEIFLDIACTFKGHKHDKVTKILGDAALSGIEELVDKCLLYVDKYDGLGMHDSIQEMGMETVRSESRTNPEKRSRLWTYKDVCLILKHHKGTEAIKSIILDMTEIPGVIQVSPTAFDRMLNLFFLKFEDYSDSQSKIMLCPQGLKSLPNKLRYLHWDYFPLPSLPSNFCIENLVELRLRHSGILHLWNGVQNLVNLRVIDLTRCKYLMSIPDLSQAINLETLLLFHCEHLVKVPCLNHLKYLKELHLEGCFNLKSFPLVPNHLPYEPRHLNANYESKLNPFSKLESIRFLSENHSEPVTFPRKPYTDAEYKFILKSLPDEPSFVDWSGFPFKSLPSNFCPENLFKLSLRESRIEQLWNGKQNLVNLRVLDLGGCKNLIRIPDLSQAINLEELYLLLCRSLVKLPCLNHLKYLIELDLTGSNLKKFPKVPNHLPRLKLSDTKIKEVPDCVENLQVQHLSMPLSKVKNVSSNIYKLGSLTELDLSYCPIAEFPEVPWSSSSLNLWTLRMNCTRIQHLPSSILKSLEVLDVRGCKYLKSLARLPPSLASLDANGCMLLEEVSFADQNQTTIWKSFPLSTFGHCFNLKQNAIKNIVDNELLKVQGLAKQLANEYYLPESKKLLLLEEERRLEIFADKTCALQCHFPGSEIPESFEHQSPNSSIIVKLEPKRCGSRFLGFAVCIVLHGAGKKYHERFIVFGKCKLKSIDDDDNHIFQFYWKCDLHDEEHMQHPDLVSIYFGGHGMFCEKKVYEASFDFFSYCYSPENNIIVKKCGVHVEYLDVDEAGEVVDF